MQNGGNSDSDDGTHGHSDPTVKVRISKRMDNALTIMYQNTHHSMLASLDLTKLKFTDNIGTIIESLLLPLASM